jgi:hypothetical protein
MHHGYDVRDIMLMPQLRGLVELAISGIDYDYIGLDVDMLPYLKRISLEIPQWDKRVLDSMLDKAVLDSFHVATRDQLTEEDLKYCFESATAIEARFMFGSVIAGETESGRSRVLIDHNRTTGGFVELEIYALDTGVRLPLDLLRHKSGVRLSVDRLSKSNLALISEDSVWTTLDIRVHDLLYSHICQFIPEGVESVRLYIGNGAIVLDEEARTRLRATRYVSVEQKYIDRYVMRAMTLLPALETLYINSVEGDVCEVDDFISESIETLIAEGAWFTDCVVEALYEWPKLRSLYIDDANVSAEAVMALKQRRPNMSIAWRE